MATESAMGSPENSGSEIQGTPGGSAGPDSLIRFAGGIAHDFNNLLTTIIGYAELILAESPDTGPLREQARQILRAGSKASEVVDMILAYAGSPSLTIETFDLNLMLESMKGFLRIYLGDSIFLDLKADTGPAPVRGERGRLQLALVNLVMNANEAMPGGGTLELATRRLPDGDPGGFEIDPRGPRVEISVRDTGCGMTKEALAHAFEPYFSTKGYAHAHGSGLGLASVQGIVRQFKGSIRAESEPGKGCRFRICLPLAIPAAP